MKKVAVKLVFRIVQAQLLDTEIIMDYYRLVSIEFAVSKLSSNIPATAVKANCKTQPAKVIYLRK